MKPTYIFDHFSLILLMMRIFLDKSRRGSQKVHFMYNNFFFRKSCDLWNNVENYGGAIESINNNTAHALYMLEY